MTSVVTNERPTALIAVLTAAATTVLLWASAFVAVRGIGHTFGPGAIALGRQATATLALTIAVALRSARRHEPLIVPAGRMLPGILGWGVLWFGLYNLAFNTAERYLDAGTTSFLVNLAPLLVAVLAGLFLREGFPIRLLVGMAIALGGVGIIAFGGASSHGSLTGISLGLAAAVLYAAGALGQKRLLSSGVDALTMTWLGSAISLVVLAPFVAEFVAELREAPPAPIWLVAYLGVGPTAIGFSTWAFVLARVTAGRTAATTYLVPACVVLMAWSMLGEMPTATTVAGGMLTLGGVGVATLRGTTRFARRDRGIVGGRAAARRERATRRRAALQYRIDRADAARHDAERRWMGR